MMGCETYRTGGGGFMIVCSKGPARAKCRCGYTGTRLCDWNVGPGRTCDRPLCPSCTHEPAEGKDLCAEHAKIWADRRPTPPPTPAASGSGPARTE